MRLHGQTAVVTGASRGIGRAVAEGLAHQGARLVIVSRSAAPLRQAARELGLIAEVRAVRADVSRPADVRRVFAAVAREFEAPDIVVNNAGMAEFRLVAETSDDLWLKTLGANLTGVFLCCRAALELMTPRQRGHIVNIISTAAIVPFAATSAYGAAKAGALQFTRVMREEVRATGIRVTALLPGPTDTEIWARSWPEAPRDRMMRPADVAEALLAAVTLPETAVAEEILLRPPSGNL